VSPLCNVNSAPYFGFPNTCPVYLENCVCREFPQKQAYARRDLQPWGQGLPIMISQESPEIAATKHNDYELYSHMHAKRGWDRDTNSCFKILVYPGVGTSVLGRPANVTLADTHDKML